VTSYLHNGRVTVVLPTYNRADLLPHAIETALDQTARDRCDILVVDDGSTDDTPAVVARYGSSVSYVRQPNGGLAAARNAGIRATDNEFIALLDDDDLWQPDKIATQLAAFERHPEAVLVGGRVIDRFPDGRERPHFLPPIPLDRPVDLAPLLFERNFLPPSSVMIRRTALHAAGLFDPRMRRSQDSHLWVKLACRGRFVIPDAVVATYFVAVPGALSNNTFSQLSYQLRGRYRLRRELRLRPDCRLAWERGVDLSLTNLRDVAFREGRYVAAARYALQALLHQPLRRERWEWARLFSAAARAAQ
jgi:glycosyltransferase involved in cell wall biosynthesis